jgi:hypothetical protein
MIDEPLERCICTGLAGFIFEDRPAGGRRVAIGCATCGTQTASFPLNQIEDAILAWEAGEFADGAPISFGETTLTRPDWQRADRPSQFAPSKLRS